MKQQNLKNEYETTDDDDTFILTTAAGSVHLMNDLFTGQMDLECDQNF
jgi:hypothetical protein